MVALPPTNTPARASFNPAAAAAKASGQDASCNCPLASLINGVVILFFATSYLKAQRPLSQFHSSFTDASSPASRRKVFPRLTSVRIAHPDAQCSHAESVETKSNGLALNRYEVPVNAPTGQICTVFPE